MRQKKVSEDTKITLVFLFMESLLRSPVRRPSPEDNRSSIGICIAAPLRNRSFADPVAIGIAEVLGHLVGKSHHSGRKLAAINPNRYFRIFHSKPGHPLDTPFILKE